MGLSQAILLAKKESLAWDGTTKRGSSQPTEKDPCSKKDLGKE